jgi:hypothetical protein
LRFDAQGSSFATGTKTYAYRLVTTRDTMPQMMAPITLEQLAIEAVLDTGAPFAICSPAVALALGLDS